MAKREFHPSVIDYILFSVTICISLGIGLYHGFAGRGQSSTAKFLVGDRVMRALPVAISFCVTNISSISFLGLPAEIYHYGIGFSLFLLSIVLANILSAWIVVPLIFPLKLTSAYEYQELRFKSRVVRLVGSAMDILQNVIFMGVVSYGTGVAVEAVTGFPARASTFIVTFAAMVYTTIGGFVAVVWTDVFQLAIMLAGMLALCIKAAILTRGPDVLWNTNVAGKRIRPLQFNPDPSIRTSFWTTVIGGTTLWFSVSFSQVGVQRIASMTTMKEAKRVLLYSTPVFVGLVVMLLFEGLFAYTYYALKGCDPYVQGVISDPNGILPYFLVEVCSDLSGLTGIFMAALFSASLSSLSSCLAGNSAIALKDFVNILWPNMTDKRATIAAKCLVLLFGLLSLSIYFLAADVGGPVTQIINVFVGAVNGPKTGIFILGAFFPLCNVHGVLAGVTTSLAITYWIAFCGSSVRIPWLPPAPSENCWINNTSAANTTMGWQNDGTILNITSQVDSDFPVYTDLPHNGSGLNKLYSTSFMLYSVTGTLLTVIVGIFVSLLTGRRKTDDVDPRLVSHVVRRWYYPENNEVYSDVRLGLISPDANQEKSSPGRQQPKDQTSSDPL